MNEILNQEFLFKGLPKIVYGPGALRELGEELRGLECNQVFLVVDPFMYKDKLSEIKAIIGKRYAGVFYDIPPQSSVDTVEQGAQKAKSQGVDGIVSIGGGSTIDTAKGIAILITHGNKLKDHEGYQNVKVKIPHIAVPTTTGTGSEVTSVAVIKDEQEQRKMVFGHVSLTPNIAILDPELTLKMPAWLTAGTGMDALSHAVEAIHSTERTPFSNTLAFYSLHLLRGYFFKAYKEPLNIEAKGAMLIAANLAGAAFNNASVGLCHAIAHTLGALYNIHHGIANSIALKAVIKFNAEKEPSLYQEVVKLLNIGKSPKELINWIEDLRQNLKLPLRLRDLKVPKSGLDQCVELTLSDPAIVGNSRMVEEPEELIKIYREIW
jgi:alcohol dehydrogenase